jgi:hypothetical protein
MCLPEYVYGLILIESLGGEIRPSVADSVDNTSRRKLKATYRPPRKILAANFGDAENTVPAGA